jgi:hypothetical protein
VGRGVCLQIAVRFVDTNDRWGGLGKCVVGLGGVVGLSGCIMGVGVKLLFYLCF